MNKEESVLQGRLNKDVRHYREDNEYCCSIVLILEMKGRVCFIGKMRDGVYCREDEG